MIFYIKNIGHFFTLQSSVKNEKRIQWAAKLFNKTQQIELYND